MAFIYRVEDDLQYGMYHSEIVDDDFTNIIEYFKDIDGNQYHEHVSRVIHPTPAVDRFIGPFWNSLSVTEKQEYFFGFSSIEQYKNWTIDSRHRRLLAGVGYHLSLYSVDDQHFKNSSRQALFNRPKSTFLRRFTTYEFDKEKTNV